MVRTTDPERSGPDKTPRSPVRTEALIFIAAMVLALIPTLQLLGAHEFNPTTLLKVGERSAARPTIDQDFGSVVYVNGYGHDGQQFYVVARELPDLRTAEGKVDRLRYRSRRIVLPAMVLPLPNGPPKVWGMFAITLISIGAAAVAAGRLAARAGTPPWLGVLMGVTPALVFSLQGTLADALGIALVLWGLVVWRSRFWLAVALFTVAILAREAVLTIPLGCLVIAGKRERLRLLIPFAVYAAWVVFTGLWLPKPTDNRNTSVIADATNSLTLPFRGWFDAGIDSFEGLSCIVLVLISLYAAQQLRQRLPEVAVALVVDAFFLVISNIEVTFSAANIARITPFALPALAIVLVRRFGPSPLHRAPATG